MTISQAITYADNAMPNNMPHPEKLRHLSVLDGRVRRELIDRCEGGPSKPFCPYEARENFDPNAELTVPAPYDEIYIHYLGAMIAHAEGEPQRYEACKSMFDTLSAAFAADYMRDHKPRGGAGFRF